MRASCSTSRGTSERLWQRLGLQGETGAGAILASLAAQGRLGPGAEVEAVDLEFSDVRDADLATLHGLRRLKRLNLNCCHALSDAGLAPLFATLHGLEEVRLYWGVHVADETLKALGRASRRLRVLNLSGCKQVTDEGLLAAATQNPGLEVLDLTRLPNVTDDGATGTVLNCPRLRHLNLFANSHLTPKFYPFLAVCAFLEFLDFCGHKNLDDASLEAIAECHRLKHLNCTWCPRLTDVGVCAVARNCPELALLSLHGILGVTDRCVVELQAYNRPGALHTLDVNGCTGIAARTFAELHAKFPGLQSTIHHTS